MEEIKKQILLINLANYNETVNNVSKFKLNDREINLFCDIMQQFAEKYHTEQLRIHDVSGRSEQLKAFDELFNYAWNLAQYSEEYAKLNEIRDRF